MNDNTRTEIYFRLNTKLLPYAVKKARDYHDCSVCGNPIPSSARQGDGKVVHTNMYYKFSSKKVCRTCLGRIYQYLDDPEQYSYARTKILEDVPAIYKEILAILRDKEKVAKIKKRSTEIYLEDLENW